MICNLNFAIALSQRRNVSEIVVSRAVLKEVLQKTRAEQVTAQSLNVRQSKSEYFLHKVAWRGIVFLHMSQDRLSPEEIGSC